MIKPAKVEPRDRYRIWLCYSDGTAGEIDLSDLAVLGGHFPPRAQGLVVEWASLRQEELREAWNRAKRLEPPGTTDSLE